MCLFEHVSCHGGLFPLIFSSYYIGFSAVGMPDHRPHQWRSFYDRQTHRD
jgi:hypothetical protein